MTERRIEKSSRNAGGVDDSVRTFLMLTFAFSTVVWFWRRREVALAAWRDDGVDGGLPANQRVQPSAAAL